MADTSGYLTTHVLDTAHGVPAAGIAIVLYRIEGEARHHIRRMVTNHDGRTDSPLIPKGELATGIYELVFAVGDYYGTKGGDPAFLDIIPIRFSIADPHEHVHVPLLVSGYGYSTYKGS